MLALALVVPLGCSSQRAATTSTSAPKAATVPVVAPTVGLSSQQRRLFERFMKANRDRPEAYEGKTAMQIVNFEIGYENGLAAVAKYERGLKANAKRIGELIDASVLSARDGERLVTFAVVLRNRTGRAIEHVDLGLTVTDRTTARIVGTIELNVDHALPPRSTARFSFPVRYASFGSAAGTMMAAAGHPRAFTVRPDAVTFADGQHVGIEDD